MRIGVYIPGANETSGGAFTFENNILTSILKNHDQDNVFIFSYNNDSRFEKSKANFIKLERVNRLIGKWRINKNILKPNNYISLLDKELKEREIDILWCASQLFEETEIPYIYTVWDLDHRIYPFFPEVSMGGEWEDRDNLYRKRIEKASFILCGTEVGKKEIMSFYNISDDRIKVLPFPISDIEKEKFEDFKKPFEGEYIFYPSTYYPHKNHFRILQSLIILEKKYGVKLFAIFSGKDGGNKQYLQEKCKYFNLEKRVLFYDFVPRGNLIGLYKNALALVFASYFGPDNFPPLEAFLLKCPVVASRVSGSEEQLKDNALLVDTNDANEFADAIYLLIKDKELRMKLVDKAYNFVRNWTFDDYTKEVFSIIKSFEAYREVWGSNLYLFYKKRNIITKILKKIF